MHEKRFSKFLKLQMDSEYERRASRLWEELSKKCGRTNPELVDSFNYTSPRCLPDLRHINGDLTNPIIGIDSEGISPDSLAFRFTKASRRADLAIDKGMRRKREAMPGYEIGRIVIFGHSLAKADYNYLFPLFDYISLTNPTVLSDLVFAWSYPTDDIGNYSDIQMRECKNKLRTDVVTLMSAYFEYRGEERASSRGFDMLTAMGKIHFVQIPTASELGLEPRKKQWDKAPGNVEARRKQHEEDFFAPLDNIKNEANKK